MGRLREENTPKDHLFRKKKKRATWNFKKKRCKMEKTPERVCAWSFWDNDRLQGRKGIADPDKLKGNSKRKNRSVIQAVRTGDQEVFHGGIFQ